MKFTSFEKDLARGKVGEQIFIEDFLDFLNIQYEDVTSSQGFQVIDSDYLAKIGLYEIKTNYKDDKMLIIEEYTNCDEKYGKIRLGWFYKSKADMLVFISKETRAMILVPFNKKFKSHYEKVKNNFTLKRNKISEHNGQFWQSAYRRVPLKALDGYFAYYRRLNLKKEV